MSFDIGKVISEILGYTINLISIPFRVINDSLVIKSVLLTIVLIIALALFVWIIKHRNSWKERIY